MKIINQYKIKDLKQLVLDNKHQVLLYGAGLGVSSYSRILVAALKHNNIEPKYFVDDDSERHGSELLGLKIIGPENIESCVGNPLVIISSNYFESIFKSLKKISKSFPIYSSTGLLQETPSDAYLGIMDFNEVQRRLHIHTSKLNRILIGNEGSDELVFNAIDIQVTEKCSMKCIDCSNLMQYYEKPINADKNLLESSIEKLLFAVDKIYDARVLGGEPFLYNELDRVLVMLANSTKVQKITVYSNATFVPKEHLLIALKHPKILVEITDYDELSKRHREMMDVFDQLGISYITHKPQNWTDSARIVKNNLTDSELSTMFERCCVNDALTLLHGKIYHCPFSGNAHNLGAIEFDESDWVDVSLISNPEDLRINLKAFYFKKNYQTACKYCLGRDYTQEQVVPAIQTKKSIPIPIFSAK